MSDGRLPLIVDVDGTLVRGDLLWEGLIQLCVQRPSRLPGLLPALIRGKAAFKAYVARESPLPLDIMPLDPAALKLIEDARAEGRPVVLASGAHESHMAALCARVGADASWASDGAYNLTGVEKLARIRLEFPAFDYVGNDTDDLPLWAAARRAFALNPGRVARRRGVRTRPDLIVVSSRRSGLGGLLRALRPHQWSKNALLVLPALAAHLTWTWTTALDLAAGFIAFSALASSVYLLNDLADLPYDRAHVTKRARPIAAGELPIPVTLAAIGTLLVIAAAVSLPLPGTFKAVLAAYLVATTAYSLVLKRKPVVDVITLAGLYATRVVGGAALAMVPLSRWFLAFSVFFFFSLALVKRVVELRQATTALAGAAGRGYAAADLPVLSGLGAGAAVVSSLVYCLYITSGDVGELYSLPDLLWLGLPLLLYWQARVWLLTGRDRMVEDPVVFALRDRVSHLVLLAFLLVVWFAA
jgi:4-hydroxybenzoate polyprenyltransferase/phosphoserine phosphatase